LDTKLKNILVPENIVLSFWNPEDVFCTYVDFEPLRCRIFLENKAEIIKKYSDFINKSPLLLETYYKYNDSLKYISKLFMFYGAIALPSSIIFGKNILPDITIFGKNISPNVEDFKHLSPTTFSGVLAWTIGLATSEKTSDKTKTVISTWNNEKNVIEEIAYFDETAALFKYTHKKISLLSEYLTNIKEIEKISLEYPEFAESLPVIKNFSKMLQELREKSPNFDTLINLLETKTIKGKYCRLEWFSRVSIAFRLMNEQKENFIPLMLAVGEIDAQLTIAKIYKDFQNKDVTFCFPEFIENSETPQLSIKDFWNPLLDPEKVVTNSIDLGCNGHPRNVIITGPIAGGKSTITTAIIYSAILAQTLGIAPAKELKMSMFNFIRTYFKITEDIAAGLSHFNAGVTRAMQLLVTAKNLKDNDFAIFGVDELFNGTSEDEAKPPVETFLQELGENSKVILITNTHLHEITNLEKTGFFENCQVPVLEKENDEIEPLYKIIPGISMQNDVVLKLLAKRGINPEFIKKAQNLLENKKQKKLLTLQNETREI
ncbi:hypothetical protein L6269_03115, partial [Candidatus Dependentiae bacterium]|nr:hypothetical protein [Candidatus Dependentiae bacterium]